MKLPIKPIIEEVEPGLIHIVLEYPSWNIKSLIRWIFTKTIVLENYYEIYYKIKTK